MKGAIHLEFRGEHFDHDLDDYPDKIHLRYGIEGAVSLSDSDTPSPPPNDDIIFRRHTDNKYHLDKRCSGKDVKYARFLEDGSGYNLILGFLVRP
jgi:hypothetical protein